MGRSNIRQRRALCDDARLIDRDILGSMSTRRIISSSLKCDGFILPFAIGVLTLLYLLATAGYSLSVIELRRSQAHRASVEAFYAANGALQQFVGEFPVPVATPDSYSYVIARAETTVSTQPLLKLDNGDLLQRVISRATLRPPEGGDFRRSVGLTLLVMPRLQPPAALTVVNTLQSTVSSGVISGFDVASPPGCANDPSSAGIVALPGGFDPNNGTLLLLGDPPYLELPTRRDLARVSGLRWRALMDPDGPPRDVRWPEEPWPAFVPASRWPIIELTASTRLDAAQSGRGAILARGDLELAKDFRWEGLILVGGALRITGPVRVEGGVMAGLDALTGAPVSGHVVEGDGVELRFHSCHLREATRALALQSVALPGSWYEWMGWPP